MEIMAEEIINRVTNSSLVTIDLEDWYDKSPRIGFDLTDFLFQGIILKELEFRSALKEYPWSNLKDVHLAVYCSVDAIVPTWAYMLVSNLASPFASTIHFCEPEQLDTFLFDRFIEELNIETYRDQKVIVKGCSKHPVPVSAYVTLTNRLSSVVQSIMYGEACSNVPIFKRKKIETAN